jgi:hypothetical protein
VHALIIILCGFTRVRHEEPLSIDFMRCRYSDFHGLKIMVNVMVAETGGPVMTDQVLEEMKNFLGIS